MDSETGTLLVVDDNELNRDMLSRRLQRRGYEVATAEDGAVALEMIEQRRFDVVLLDVMMPGIDGFEVLRRVRKTHPPTELPIIMATAKDDREDIVEALKLGANDYVTKPLDFPVVFARVQTQLSLKRAVDQIIALEKDLERKNQELEHSNKRMKRDLVSAAKVQQSLLPTTPPQVADVRFAWKYEPCDELAGDILNIFQLDEDHVVFYLVDVSGHGVPAALLSVTLSRVLAPQADRPSLVRRQRPNSNALEPTPPGDVAGELNRRFPMNPQTQQYHTLFYGLLNVKTYALSYVCAGHPGPVHISEGSDPQVLNSPAFAIGWFPDAEYESDRLQLQPGDRLYLFSDGVGEAMNAEDVQFGEDRIAGTLQDARGLSVEESLARVLDAAQAWCQKPFDDDVSAMAVEINGAATQDAEA